jgi:hypothetical protein
MKTAGIVIACLGLLWVMHDCLIGFTSYQHLNWVVSSKHLSDSETISRDEAVTAMRDISLDLKNRHRIILIPTALMVLGGVLVIVDGRRTKKNSDRKIHLRSTRGL